MVMKKRKSNLANVVIAALIIFFLAMIAYTARNNRLVQTSGGRGGIPVSVARQDSPQNSGGLPAGNGTADGNPRQGGGSPENGSRQAGNGAAGGNPRQGGGQQARNVAAVRVKPVVLGTINNSIMINGDVLAAREISIFPVVAGKIVELRLNVGDTVKERQIVAVVDPSRPGEVYSGSPVRSTISGTVLQRPYSTGDTVSQQSAIYVIGDLSYLVVETFVPERFSSDIRTGLRAEIFFDSMPGLTFTGIVNEVSPVLDPSSRALRIKLRIDKNDPRIRPGMFATVSLVTASRRNIPVIPREAVINTYNSWIVFVVNSENKAERREILLGLESETMVEALSGLSVDDIVVTSGQNFLSNNESVRILTD
jgi:multidrug efflux pump subunit AcrA (membrane-fusion protein)